MLRDVPHILLVNPWIHDFAAYDFWAKPLGLLQLAAILRQSGVAVTYIDCLDRFHPRAPQSDPLARNGRGPYLKTRIETPPGLVDVARNFSRYGIRKEWLEEDLSILRPPDLILVTSLMTYWYTGVAETVRLLKGVFPETPLILGGIYASLCREHAATVPGVDRVVAGPGEEEIAALVAEFTGYPVSSGWQTGNMDSLPYPAFDLQTRIGYVPVITSKGCPFSCAYCASSFLNPVHARRQPESVLMELIHWHRNHRVDDFVFYDDALLVGAGRHIVPLLESVIRSDLRVRFHTPNALHVREINDETAVLMHRAGFKTIRLGLESAEFSKQWDLDEKLTEAEFQRAIRCLRSAGFRKEQIGAYLLAGLPGQQLEAVLRSIRIVADTGVTPIIAYYSPIPHTPLWDRAVASSRYDLAADPIFTNNAISPCQEEPFSWSTISKLKQWAGGK
ncbi:MAG: B12-binding domain-containing radical SAM protein [Thermodesulfobacteriota bacterium]